jgi:hypothetical protein
MKNRTTLELAYRMNEIEKEINELSIEYNIIIEELKRRMPKLENDVNLQKKKVRKHENNNI